MTTFFALSTRGLEELVAAEIEEIPTCAVTGKSYRCVTGICTGALHSLTGLRCADDVFIELGTLPDLERTRAGLSRLTGWAEGLDYEAVLAAIRGVRELERNPVWSVSASFVGKRNYSSEEMKTALAQALLARGGVVRPENEADVNLRIFVEHDQARLGARLGRRALHDRAYRQENRPGALKAPVAAAMLRLLDAWPGGLLLDPFCGTGTILIEGAANGLRAVGADLDQNATLAARANSAHLSTPLNLLQADALRLPLRARSVDGIVSNLPWGKQVPVDADLHRLYEQSCAEMERVLHPAGKLALLTSQPDWLAFRRLVAVQRLEISVFGQNPVITVFANP